MPCPLSNRSGPIRTLRGTLSERPSICQGISQGPAPSPGATKGGRSQSGRPTYCGAQVDCGYSYQASAITAPGSVSPVRMVLPVVYSPVAAPSLKPKAPQFLLIVVAMFKTLVDSVTSL